VVLDNIRGIGELTLKGLIATQAPNLFKGVLNELLRREDITVDKVITMVEKNQPLWDQLPSDITHSLRRAAEHVTDVPWLTVEWFIEAIKTQHPALASLFLGWRKARNWLGRQIEAIKKELYE